MPDECNRARRRGSALIEVLVAIVVLAIGGTSLITLLGQTAYSMRTTFESQRLALAASDEMNRLVIVQRSDLLARVGHRMDRGWVVDIEAAPPSLFSVGIAQSDTGAVLLHTILYRPPLDSSDASR
jgi:Tfp pilus assembly protein PilV